MNAGDIAPTQEEKPIIDTSAKDIPVEASAEKALAMEPVLEVATQEAITVPDLEAFVVTSKMRQPLTQLARVLLGGISAQTLVSESTYVMIIEIGSGSAPLAPTPAMDILKN